MSDGSQTAWSDKDTIDLLFKKYALLKAEIHLQVKYFKNHVRNSQLLASPIIAGVSYLLTHADFHPAEANKWAWLIGLAAIITVASYLVSDIADASYQILVIAERMSAIERRINTSAGETILVWESKLSEAFNAPTYPFKGILHPLWCMRFYVAVLLFALTILLPLWGAYALWFNTTGNVFKGFIALLVIYALVSTGIVWCMVKHIEKNLRAEARKAIAQAMASR